MAKPYFIVLVILSINFSTIQLFTEEAIAESEGPHVKLILNDHTEIEGYIIKKWYGGIVFLRDGYASEERYYCDKLLKILDTRYLKAAGDITKGGLSGAAAGAAIGAIFGGIGAIPGAIIGALLWGGASATTTDYSADIKKEYCY